MLSDFPVSSISISSGSGSSMARAELEDPEMLEEWDRERTFLLRNQCVPVTPTATEMMLCVANLPPDYTEEQFLALVKSCGEVRRGFLMISEKTGEQSNFIVLSAEFITISFTLLSVCFVKPLNHLKSFK